MGSWLKIDKHVSHGLIYLTIKWEWSRRNKLDFLLLIKKLWVSLIIISRSRISWLDDGRVFVPTQLFNQLTNGPHLFLLKKHQVKSRILMCLYTVIYGDKCMFIHIYSNRKRYSVIKVGRTIGIHLIHMYISTFLSHKKNHINDWISIICAAVWPFLNSGRTVYHHRVCANRDKNTNPFL